jgi:hypothetical protein
MEVIEATAERPICGSAFSSEVVYCQHAKFEMIKATLDDKERQVSR